MQRIAIIGCGCSGKSTLAGRLGQILSLPVHHLDRLYWRPGWTETPKEEWEALQSRLCRESAWIMDGNYGGTMDLRLTASDTVIFLDLPTRVCLWSAIQRFRRFRGRSRPDMSDGCPEHFTFEFLWWIATYRTTRRPRILHKLETISGQKHVVILKSRKAAEDFLSSLTLQKGVR